MAELSDTLLLQLDKAIAKKLTSRQGIELGKDVARVYQRAEVERFFKGFNSKGGRMRKIYSQDYRKEKSLFVQGKGSLYKERSSDIYEQYKANKVNDFARLTGTLANSIIVESTQIRASTFRRKAQITLKMYIDDISDAVDYYKEVDDWSDFFGFMYKTKDLPAKYLRQLDRIKRKYLL